MFKGPSKKLELEQQKEELVAEMQIERGLEQLKSALKTSLMHDVWPS